MPQAQQGLAQDPGLRERFLNWMRGNTSIGQAVAPTIEQGRNANTMQAIQNAGVDINRQIPPAQVAPPAAVNPYSVEYMIKEAQNNAPRYDRLGNKIR